MKLMLNHTQRLNLHALLGAQRADVGSVRAIWGIQDRIALDDHEEKAIELKREMIAGHERVIWNPALGVPPRAFDFSEMEIGRIKAAIEGWPTYAADGDRNWLQPLLQSLFLDPM